MFLRPLLLKLSGLEAGPCPTVKARLGSPVGENDRRQDYMRADLYRDADGTLVVTPFERQDSAMLAQFARADCLVVRAPFAPPIEAGKMIDIIPLRNLNDCG